MTTPDTKGYKAGSAGEHPPDVASAHPAASAAAPPGGLGGKASEGAPCEGAVSTGAPSKGAKPGRSLSRLTHGLYGQSFQLVLGKLPKSLARVEDDAYRFRAAVEAAVVGAHGSISLTNACLIATAARWERHGLLALRWLREGHDALDDAQRLAYSKAIAEGSERRDKAIASLKLDRDTAADLWAAFDAQQARQRAAAALPVNSATVAGDASNSVLRDTGANR
ncbi:MAG TPA: hypothetical protein PK867_07050 [Pirellulales bacterium]|nr:hypothetical protein [Pirellulales bacterium]